MLNFQNLALLLTLLFLLWKPAICKNGCTEKCGGIHIQFPFHLRNSKFNHTTGYPRGFDLLCTDAGETVLDLPSVPINLLVKDIDYKSQQIQLYDPQNCLPRELMKLGNSSISPFKFESYGDRNVSFFRCNSVSCPILQLDSGDDFLNPEIVSCTKLSEVYSVQWYVRDYLKNIVVAEWTNPNCSSCEAQGSKCRYKNGTQSEIECFVCPTNGLRTSTIVLIVAGMCGILVSLFSFSVCGSL